MDATNLARELIDLHEHPRQVPPFSTRYPGLTPESGYAAARRLHAHRLARGWTLAGRKNGFTDRGLWERYGVTRSPAALLEAIEWVAHSVEIVSTGTLTDAHPVKAGERWSTVLEGLSLPGLSLTFE